MSESPHFVRRAVTVSLLASAALGMIPPVRGEVPPTVVRAVPLDLAELVPEAARAAAGPAGVVASERSWTDRVTTCAPIRFTMVGFTWRQSGRQEVPVEVSWGGPEAAEGPLTLHADPSEAPDPGSPDDAGIDGTTPLWTGEARCVRLRLRLPEGERLRDLRAVFLNTSGTAEGPSALGVIGSAFSSAWDAVAGVWAPQPAGAMTRRPAVVTRPEWGADERLRRVNCDGKPDYAPKVKMAYVHHTVSRNSYARSEADDIVRGIYSYHVRGRGFCDIAYNFLISKYGDIFEGRYGGMDRPVIGGHAMGFNTGSTGIAAIGDFSSRGAPRVVVRAFRRLLAWRLDVAHLRPRGSTIMVSSGGSTTRYDKGERVRLKIVSGHRDTGYTTCPGHGLYSKLRTIRRGAQHLGLPKIWTVRRSAGTVTPGESTVRYGAGFSGRLAWDVEIVSMTSDAVVRRFSGTDDQLRVTWDGRDRLGVPVAPGRYRVLIEARRPGDEAARPATLRTRVAAP